MQETANKTKLDVKEMVHLALVLFLITFIVALLLSVVNGFTSKVIKESEDKKINSLMSEVMPSAASFELLNFVPDEKSSIKNMYEGRNGDQITGYIVRVTPQGYSDVIDILVAFDTQRKITDVKVVSVNDTPGFGTKVKDSDFLDQFKNKTSIDDVSTISGATISSTAFKNGVNDAVTAVAKITEQ